MRGRAIGWSATAAIGIIGATLLASPAVASGGGGCGRAVTDERGTQVRVRNYCFRPTILRVQRGSTITWVNHDTFAHTVLGANGTWGGYDELRTAGATTRYRFVRSGVYPYVCTYHPGMIGAIVVGDGTGGGIADAMTTADGPVVPAPRVQEAQPVAPVRASVDAGGPPLFGWGIGVLLASGALLMAVRSRRAWTG